VAAPGSGKNRPLSFAPTRAVRLQVQVPSCMSHGALRVKPADFYRSSQKRRKKKSSIKHFHVNISFNRPLLHGELKKNFQKKGSDKS
jgi:hypothetical protein